MVMLQRFENFLPHSESAFTLHHSGWTRPPPRKHPKTLVKTGGRAAAGFLPSVQKPAPRSLDPPYEF